MEDNTLQIKSYFLKNWYTLIEQSVSEHQPRLFYMVDSYLKFGTPLNHSWPLLPEVLNWVSLAPLFKPPSFISPTRYLFCYCPSLLAASAQRNLVYPNRLFLSAICPVLKWAKKKKNLCKKSKFSRKKEGESILRSMTLQTFAYASVPAT